MFKKTKFKLTPKKPAKTKSQIKAARTKTIITENLKKQVLPHIVNDFAKALKDLKNGESLRFGKLGTFKKIQRSVNGYTGYQYFFKAHSLLKK
jgi:hypothetical protein